jgi:IPT/TIG domain
VVSSGKTVTEWPGDLLGRADNPRPLRSGFRDRLEEVLRSGDASPETTTNALGADRAARLAGSLADPIDDPLADALANVDRPRPLPPTTNRALERAFARRNGRRRVALASAAAAVIVLAVGLTLTLSGSSRPASRTSTEALAPPISAPATSGVAASGNGATSAGRATSSAAPAPQALGSDQAAAPQGRVAVTTPAVVAISPASGSADGGTTVTITGRGMENAASVRFGGAPARFRIVSATQLRAVTPSHAAGSVAVTVSTAARTEFTSNGTVHFTYH